MNKQYTCLNLACMKAKFFLRWRRYQSFGHIVKSTLDYSAMVIFVEFDRHKYILHDAKIFPV